MGYGNESRQGLVIPDGLAPISLAAVADNLRLFRVLAPITVLRIGVLITTANPAGAVVDFDRRVTPGSDVGRVDKAVGTLTFPASADAVGEIVYRDVAVDLSPGDEVSVQVTTAGDAGSAGIPILEYIARHEVPGNFAEMIASS